MQQPTFVSRIQESGAPHPAPTSETATVLARVEQLFKEFKDVSDKPAKMDKLHEAYGLCLSQIKTGDPKIMAHISMILGEFGILHYAQKPQYPGKTFPESAQFTISKQMLLGALQAFLVRIKASQVEIDFNAPGTRDLKRMPETILDHNPFAAVEAPFIQADRTVLIDMARSRDFENFERLHFSKMLRYLNGAARHIRGVFEQREPNEQDNKLTCNALYLAREFARCDDNEFWELMYNDWADVYKAEGSWNELKQTEHAAWLIQNAKNDSQIARVNNKFFRGVEGAGKSLNNCMEIFKRKMASQDYQDLEAITQGKLLVSEQVERLVNALFSLDLKEKDYISLGWFSIIPSNLAFRLMEANSGDLPQIEGLLRLSKAIVENARKAGDHSFNFQSIDRNWVKFQLYSQQPIREATASLKQIGATLMNLQGSLEERNVLLQQAKAAALLAKQAFEQYQVPQNDPLGLLAIVQQQISISQQLLAKIEEITPKPPHS
ncbi:MAG: hypothetical protein LLG04_01435 [Parachlamydia sp.]|nr:hypothetical protein [Parachlamydia sp.]